MQNDILTKVIKVAIQEFEQVRENIRAIRHDLIARYSWNPDEDFRINIFEQLDNLIRSLSLSLAFHIRCISDRDWIHPFLFKNIDTTKSQQANDFFQIRRNLDTFHRTGFVYTLTQVTEGAIRSLLRAIDPSDRGTDNFSLVCGNLAHKMENPSPLNDFRAAIDLLREIRNTIHNNGIYFSLDSNDKKEIKYRGKTYVFEDGKPQNNSGYHILWCITEDVASILKIIIEDQNVNEIDSVPIPANYLILNQE